LDALVSTSSSFEIDKRNSQIPQRCFFVKALMLRAVLWFSIKFIDCFLIEKNVNILMYFSASTSVIIHQNWCDL
jgi:hypothetical protein